MLAWRNEDLIKISDCFWSLVIGHYDLMIVGGSASRCIIGSVRVTHPGILEKRCLAHTRHAENLNKSVTGEVPMSDVSMFCFLASYLVAFGLEMARVIRRISIPRFIILAAGVAGLIAHTFFFVRSRREDGIAPAAQFDPRLDARAGVAGHRLLSDPDGAEP